MRKLLFTLILTLIISGCAKVVQPTEPEPYEFISVQELLDAERESLDYTNIDYANPID